MARVKKAVSAKAKSESIEGSFLNIGSSDETQSKNKTTESVSNVKKHVSLAHLYIIKEYIDKQSAKTIANAEGFHGIRFYNNKLQAKDVATGEWIDVDMGGSGGEIGDGADIADDDDVKKLFEAI